MAARQVRGARGTADRLTWEREWRIQIAELPLLPTEASIVVRRQEYAHVLLEDHENAERQRIEAEAMENGDDALLEQEHALSPTNMKSLSPSGVGGCAARV